jgi:hypothetical protein
MGVFGVSDAVLHLFAPCMIWHATMRMPAFSHCIVCVTQEAPVPMPNNLHPPAGHHVCRHLLAPVHRHT